MDIIWGVVTDQPGVTQYFWNYAAAKRFADQNAFKAPLLMPRPNGTPVA